MGVRRHAAQACTGACLGMATGDVGDIALECSDRAWCYFDYGEILAGGSSIFEDLPNLMEIGSTVEVTVDVANGTLQFALSPIAESAVAYTIDIPPGERERPLHLTLSMYNV